MPPNTGWIFNTIVPANITGEAAHRRTTCGNASNPCSIKTVSVIGSTSCRGRYIGESPSRGEGFGAGQSRPVVLMSVLGGERDGCGRTRPCEFACGLFAPHLDRLILASPLMNISKPVRQDLTHPADDGRSASGFQLSVRMRHVAPHLSPACPRAIPHRPPDAADCNNFTMDGKIFCRTSLRQQNHAKEVYEDF